MARFRLKGKHYLNVPGTEWEQEETPLGKGGKTLRKRYHVPTYFDPEDQSDQNYPGEIIVATEASKQYPKDIIFAGPPTADMEPLDDEAQELFDSYRPIWEGRHPIESLPGTFGDALREQFEKEIESKGGLKATPNVSLAEFEELKKSNAELKEMVEKLLAMQAPTAGAVPRRI